MKLWPAGLALVAAVLPASSFRSPQQPAGEPDGMVRIRGASFDMGVDEDEVPSLAPRLGVSSARAFADSTPKHRVAIGSFDIDRIEVSNRRFGRFIGNHPEWRPGVVDPPLRPAAYLQGWTDAAGRPERASLPVVNITWYAAVAYCASLGLRLPTEAEWDYAARGGLVNRLFPWGDDPPGASRANYGASGIGHPIAVGSYPPNGYGLFDMAGNVWEFMADEWRPYPTSPQADPVAGGAFSSDGFRAVRTRRVLRGGSWGAAPVNLWTGYRDSHPPDNPTDFAGFRCATSRPSPG